MKNEKKSESNPITLQRDKGEAIAESYRREYRGGGLRGNNNQSRDDERDEDELEQELGENKI